MSRFLIQLYCYVITYCLHVVRFVWHGVLGLNYDTATVDSTIQS